MQNWHSRIPLSHQTRSRTHPDQPFRAHKTPSPPTAPSRPHSPAKSPRQTRCSADTTPQHPIRKAPQFPPPNVALLSLRLKKDETELSPVGRRSVLVVRPFSPPQSTRHENIGS